jgi:hypothetical protein
MRSAIHGRVHCGHASVNAAIVRGRTCVLRRRTLEADTLAYYVEGRYQLTPGLFAALRWNQQTFGYVDDGRASSWSRRRCRCGSEGLVRTACVPRRSSCH